MGFSLIKKNEVFQKNNMKVGVKKFLRMCLVPARAWSAHAVGIAPTGRFKLRRQMAAAGKKESTSLSWKCMVLHVDRYTSHVIRIMRRKIDV